MFVFKRNQIIVTALVVMIAIAGYLNYTDRHQADDAGIVYNDEMDISGIIPDDALIMETMENGELSEGIIGEALTNDPELLAFEDFDEIEVGEGLDTINMDVNSLELAEGEEAVNPVNSEDPGEAVFVNSNLDTPYFAEVKLEREQARAKQREILSEILNNKSVNKDHKSDAAEQMLSIQKRIEKESSTEAMIEAKGFKEVYVRINDDGVEVVVSKEKLSEKELAQIEKIVRGTTGFEVDKIQIIPLKPR